jgi:hypothetical protein
MVRKCATPLTLILFCGAFLFAEAILIVKAQNLSPSGSLAVSPTPVPPPQPMIESVKETVATLTTLGMGVVFIAGLVWWAFWGRNTQQIKEQRDGWKDVAERRGLELADVRQDLKESEDALRETERKNRRLERQIEQLEEGA